MCSAGMERFQALIGTAKTRIATFSAPMMPLFQALIGTAKTGMGMGVGVGMHWGFKPS